MPQRSATAGASAGAEGARRVRRQRAGRLAAAPVAGMAAAAGAWSWGAIAAPPAIDAVGAPVLTVVAVAGFAGACWLARDRGAGRWRAGAAGERATAAVLAGLGARWAVLHDLAVPGTRANIDHLVVGPNGVTLVDSKRWAGVVRLGRRHLRHDGQAKPEVVDHQHRCAALVAAELSRAGLLCPVRTVIVVHGAELRAGRLRPRWLRRRHVRGVAIVAPDGLRRAVGAGRRRLDRRQVAHAARVLAAALGPR